jgi:hypothetical protein
MLRIILPYALLGFFAYNTCHSHPVTYEGGTAFTMTSQPDNVTSSLNYTLHRHIAIETAYIRKDVLEQASEYATLSLNTLVHRWNALNSQGNLYAIGGLGYGGATQAPGRVYVGGLQLDFETPQFYTAIMSRYLHQETLSSVDGLVRVGVAPYIADYEGLQSWLVLQLSYNGNFSRGDVKPVALLRMFFRTVLWELGSDIYGQPWLQIMVHY